MKKYFKKLKEYEFGPKKERNLNAVSFESKQPLTSTEKEITLCQNTEWTNGEGFDVSFSSFNEVSKITSEKSVSLSTTEIDLLLASLNDLKYFNI